MKISAAVIAAMLVGLASVARADLPPATSAVGCSSNNPSGVVNAVSLCALMGAQANIALSPFVLLSANVSEFALVATESAFATVQYYFEVTGGTAGDVVPVSIDTSLSAIAGPGNYASAAIFTSSFEELVCTDGSCPSSEFHGRISTSAISGQAVLLTLSIAAEEGYFYGGNVLASADPYIQIDPTFAGSGSYAISVSPGVGNLAVSPVPEPSTWLALIAGIGTLGVRLRSRRQKRRISWINA